MNVPAIYPECAVCEKPVQYDKIRAYYEHEDTGDMVHVHCYEQEIVEESDD